MAASSTEDTADRKILRQKEDATVCYNEEEEKVEELKRKMREMKVK